MTSWWYGDENDFAKHLGCIYTPSDTLAKCALYGNAQAELYKKAESNAARNDIIYQNMDVRQTFNVGSSKWAAFISGWKTITEANPTKLV
jgi:hypothetical protein